MAIKLVVLDVDGVMCDGKYYDASGSRVLKQFCDLDFTAIKCFLAAGVDVVWLSGDDFNKAVAINRRIPFFSSRLSNGTIDKMTVMSKILKEYNVKPEEVATIGDDLFDIPTFRLSKYAFCPSNSPLRVQEAADIVLDRRSGDGLILRMLEFLIDKEEVVRCSFTDLVNIDKDEQL